MLKISRGFTLVYALFILVVLSMFGVYMIQLSTIQQSSTTQDILNSQAYQSAKAGIDWGTQQVLANQESFETFVFDVNESATHAQCILREEYNEAAKKYYMYKIKSHAATNISSNF